MNIRTISILLFALVNISFASGTPTLNPDVQRLFLPANQSLRDTTNHKPGMKAEDMATVETVETKALLESIDNNRAELLIQWMFYVNGSDQMKKDMISMRGEEGWIYIMTFVYYFQFTGDEIKEALRVFPDPIIPELEKENLFESMIQVAEENKWKVQQAGPEYPPQSVGSSDP